MTNYPFDMTSPVHFDRGVRFLSLCSGIEAASMAWCPLGWTCVAVAEIEPFPCAVLKHHYPDVPNLGNVNFITREQIETIGHVDVVIFGFPCQDLSGAGKRKGLKNADGTNTRSGLFFKCFEVAKWTKARWVVVENVPGLFSSSQGRDFATVLGELAGASFDVPRDGWDNSGFALGQNGLVEWSVLDAQYMHLAQRRERVFLVLDTGNWADRPPLLSDATSLCGYPAPSRQAGKSITHDLAPCIGASGRGFDRCGDTRGQDAVVGCLNSASGHAVPGNSVQDVDKLIPEIADCLQERDSKGSDSHLLPVAFPANLSSTQHASTEDLSPAIGAENPMAVAIPINMQAAAKNGAKSPNMLGIGNAGDPAFTVNASDQHAICCADVAPSITRNYGKQVDSSDTSKGPNVVVCPSIAFTENGGVLTDDIFAALSTNQNATGKNTAKVMIKMAVRRLTPRECERLQGFPDDFTRIPWRNKPAEKCPDGNRYKALGNSMAVPVIRWIGHQIQQAEMWEGEK